MIAVKIVMLTYLALLALAVVYPQINRTPPRFLRPIMFAVLLPFYPLPALLASGLWPVLRGNLFFTFVDEGEAKIIVRGGQFEKVVYNLSGYRLNQDGFLVPLGPGEEDPWYPWGGLRFYGLWPVFDVLVYKFPRFTSLLGDGEEHSHEEEWKDVISLRDDGYLFTMKRVESADPMDLEVKVLLTLRVMNPYRSRYGVWEWLELIINRYRPFVRDKIAQGRYEELLAERTSLGGALYEETEELRMLFWERYGVETVAVEIEDINPPADYRETTLLRYQAEQEARAIIEQAQGEAEAIEARGRGEAEAIKARGRAKAESLEAEYGVVKRYGLLGAVIRLFRPR